MVWVEREVASVSGIPEARRVQQCIGTAGTVGVKLSDPPVYGSAVEATTQRLEEMNSCLRALAFVAAVEVQAVDR